MHLALRLQLSWLGIPVAMLLSGEFVTGAVGYALRPSLNIQRLVRATSPGFVILHKLENQNMDIETAKDGFRQLARTDATLKSHINPQGRTYLQELVHHGPWGCCGLERESQFKIMKFFVEDLRISTGMETPESVFSSPILGRNLWGADRRVCRFLYDSAKWADLSCHLEIIDCLTQLGHSFDNTDEPLFASWPKPAIPDEMFDNPPVEAIDPFYIESFALIASQNPGMRY